MIKLNIKTKPFWMKLDTDYDFKVRPLSPVLYNSASQFAVRKLTLLDALRQQELEDNGESTLPDLTDPDIRIGYIQDYMAKKLGEMGIIEWKGIGDAEGKTEQPVTKENIELAMSIPWLAKIFYREYTSSTDQVSTEGNASGSSPAGTSSETVGPNTATDAGKNNSNALEEKV